MGIDDILLIAIGGLVLAGLIYLFDFLEGRRQEEEARKMFERLERLRVETDSGPQSDEYAPDSEDA